MIGCGFKGCRATGESGEIGVAWKVGDWGRRRVGGCDSRMEGNREEMEKGAK